MEKKKEFWDKNVNFSYDISLVKVKTIGHIRLIKVYRIS